MKRVWMRSEWVSEWVQMNFGGQSKCHCDAANPQLRHNLHVINMGLTGPSSHGQTWQAGREREGETERGRQQWQAVANTNIEMRSKPCQYLAKKKKQQQQRNEKMQAVRRCRAAVKCGYVARLCEMRSKPCQCFALKEKQRQQQQRKGTRRCCRAAVKCGNVACLHSALYAL